MNLLPGEERLGEFGSLFLTSHRIGKTVKHENYGGSLRSLTVIRLEHVTHCKVKNVDKPELIIVGGLVLVAAIIGEALLRQSNQSPTLIIVLGSVFGLVFIVGYFFSRQCELTIASPSVTLTEALSKKNTDRAIAFIDRLELATIEKAEKGRLYANQESLAQRSQSLAL